MSSWANSLLKIAQHTTILYSRAPSAHRLQSMSPEVCYILYNKRSSAFWKSAAIFCRVHIWWILIKYDYSLCISCTLLHCPSFPVWFPPNEFFFHRRLFFFVILLSKLFCAALNHHFQFDFQNFVQRAFAQMHGWCLFSVFKVHEDTDFEKWLQ